MFIPLIDHVPNQFNLQCVLRAYLYRSIQIQEITQILSDVVNKT